MQTTEFKLEFEICNTEKIKMPAIIVAAGSSRRMNGLNKQLLPIGGVPVLARTLKAFQNSEYVSHIVLVARECDAEACKRLAKEYSVDKLYATVSGGESRQQSVLKGLRCLPENTKNVLIQDGARPLTDNTVISAVATALKEHCAVTCAVPIKDTVKQVDKSGRVVNTPDRSSLVAVQTPQGVRVAEYLKALENAKDLSVFTDDMSVMEAAGYDVFTVPGSFGNIKVTTPEDIKLAEYLLSLED